MASRHQLRHDTGLALKLEELHKKKVKCHFLTIPEMNISVTVVQLVLFSFNKKVTFP